jgi:3-mercaptopropionate dioxygenase
MPTSADSAVESRLGDLTEAIRAVVRMELPPGRTAHLVARRLRPFLARRDLLPPERLRGDPAGYVQHVLHTEDDGSFSVVALVWLPGQHTAVHDHVSWCVTGVHQGAEREERFALAGPVGDRHLVRTDVVTNEIGDTCGFAPPGDIHRVTNAGDTLAVSLHIYGADITRLNTSVRREYHLPIHERRIDSHGGAGSDPGRPHAPGENTARPKGIR